MYKKVTLISLPKQDLLRAPGALPILAAACEDNQVDYEVRDFNLWLFKNLDRDTWHKINDNWDMPNPLETLDPIFLDKIKEFVDLVIADASDLIAVSIFTDISSCPALSLIEELNSRPERSSLDIVIGGTGIRAKIAGREICSAWLESKHIDYFIFGEGEKTFRRLLVKQTSFPGINNFDAEQLDDLDSFTLPSYKKIDPKDYNYISDPEIIITGSRGCVRSCTYCDVASYWPSFRYRSGQKIADELYQYYKTTGVKHFEFSDSLINGSLKQFREMNKALIAYQAMDAEFKISYKGQYICRGRLETKEIDYAEMKQAGCDYIFVGVESFSDRIRYDMGKKFSNYDLDFHLKMCGKYNIKNSFLMLVGYPTETQDDHVKNLDMLKKYQKYAQADVISMIVFGYTAGILKGAPLFHLQERLGIDKEFPLLDNFESSNWVSNLNPSLTLKERIRRWVELTELATDLGYSIPRNTHYINRFINILEKIQA
jgi:hypothetical protein